MADIKSMLPEELSDYMKEIGQPAYRAKQVFKWLSRGVKSFDEMSDIGIPLREILKRDFTLTVPEVLKKQISKQDGTVKYLWKLTDAHAIESVLMRYEHGNTVCVSTQVGCRMGCAFCASAAGGLIRNLEPSEMLDQVIFTQADTGLVISNLVLMGIGEPLDNFDHVLRFLSLANHPDGLNIGMRHISLSTCGITERIDKLASHNLQLTLSISLHAPDDETRSRIMPVNKSNSVEKLLEACKRYFQKTGRRISFEYALIKDVNDSDEQARLLAKQMLAVAGHVNLIPLNNVEGSPLVPGNVKRFAKQLTGMGVNVTIRRRLGADIDAACGQLRKKHRSPSKKEEGKVEH
jgi:23S rRNA (adenine2503-C2)-methyltransferase